MVKKMAKCMQCGESILFIETEKGNKMPCDRELIPFWAEPKAPKRIVTMLGKVLACHYEGDIQELSGHGYIPHFATCEEYKKNKRIKQNIGA
ncbi:MAG: hypothetical protein FWF50_01490 [Defluviitaleaceae bacterium]|nr:hypothetical protein [Defluviitaleaceae bacterium]